MTVRVFIGLGSNLGTRDLNLQEAQQALGLSVVGKSSIYETEPVDYVEQPWFLNCVIEVGSVLPPVELLDACMRVENEMGRVRKVLKGPRTIDLDILFYGDEVVNLPRLIIPHARLPERRFVLEPLAEIAPDFAHPVLHRTVAQLLAACSDTSVVRIFSPAQRSDL